MRLLSRLLLPDRPPRHFLSEQFDATSPGEVKQLLINLCAEIPHDWSSAHRWFGLFHEASLALSEAQTLLEIEVHNEPNQQQAQERLRYFEENVLSQVLISRRDLIDIYLNSPWRSAMHADDGGLIARDFKRRKSYTNNEIAELQIEENQLIRRYRSFMAAANAEVRGAKIPLSVLVGRMNHSDELVRRSAFFAYWGFIKDHESSLQELFDEILSNRQRQALVCCETSYVPVAFAELGRHDYSPADCAKFRKTVLEVVVPVLSELAPRQAAHFRRPGTVAPWNAGTWPEITPLNAPAGGKVEELLDGFQRIVSKVHPSFGEIFSDMRKRGLMDVGPRFNKGPGAFCVALQESRTSYVFGNFGVTTRDAMTLAHEFGHALHNHASSFVPNVLLRTPGLEFCEVASIGFEFLAAHFLKEWWPKAQEAECAVAWHLFQTLVFWPFMAMIDEWQHEVYVAGGLNATSRNQLWKSLSRRYRPHLDWTGCEEYEDLGWFSRPHIFTSPFYFIDYGMAQLGAVQLWHRSADDMERVVHDYCFALALGAQRSLPDLFAAAGLEFSFEPPLMKKLVDSLLVEIEKSLRKIAS